MYENVSCVHRLLVMVVEGGKSMREILVSVVHHLCYWPFEGSALLFCWSTFNPVGVRAFPGGVSYWTCREVRFILTVEQIELLLQIVSGVGDLKRAIT